MINMNIKSDNSCCQSDYNECPTIYLTTEQCEALGITAAPAAGTTYTVRCKAVAVRVTAEVEDADEGEGTEPDVNLTLRITEMELSAGVEQSSAQRAYPGMNP